MNTSVPLVADTYVTFATAFVPIAPARRDGNAGSLGRLGLRTTHTTWLPRDADSCL
jgi:hypothetical protein